MEPPGEDKDPNESNSKGGTESDREKQKEPDLIKRKGQNHNHTMFLQHICLFSDEINNFGEISHTLLLAD